MKIEELYLAIKPVMVTHHKNYKKEAFGQIIHAFGVVIIADTITLFSELITFILLQNAVLQLEEVYNGILTS